MEDNIDSLKDIDEKEAMEILEKLFKSKGFVSWKREHFAFAPNDTVMLWNADGQKFRLGMSKHSSSNVIVHLTFSSIAVHSLQPMANVLSMMFRKHISNAILCAKALDTDDKIVVLLDQIPETADELKVMVDLM